RTTVTLAQIVCQLHDKQANLRKMSEVVRKTKGKVVIFPELNLTGYLPRDDLFGQAETVVGPTVKSILKLARSTRKDIVCGLPMKDERIQGVVYNSCLFASGDGQLFRYDKMFLPTFGPFEEKVFFGHGKEAVVAQGRHIKAGLMVCYDAFFPELAKLESLKGAQMLINISAAPTTSRPYFQRVLPARAVENGVFVACCNMVGVHGSLVFAGGSVLYGPKGDELVLAKDLEQDVVEVEVDLSDIDIARRFRPLVRDTRPELLDEISGILRSGNKP
ncbi:MAG TPA: carbon-nitrogen hydrolase family protein, partial [Thermoplasmata archaeon]